MSGPGPRVLVVDDEPAIRHFLKTVLTAQGYVVFEAKTGQEALSQVVAQRPDVVVLDLGLPDMDGVQVTHLLREWTPLPILILSVRDREEDKIAALDAGADDYLTKPFGSGELLARVRAALRRAAQSSAGPIYVTDDLRVDLARRVVTLAGEEVQLTPTEYDLLRVLVSNAGKVLTHHQLLRDVWGVGYEQEMHMLRVNISNLRRKLEPDPARPHFIVTEPGVGYRLRADPDEPGREEDPELTSR
jgi:two-component system KDP operon response regulator KdpE